MAHVVYNGDEFSLCPADQGGTAQRALYAGERRRTHFGRQSRRGVEAKGAKLTAVDLRLHASRCAVLIQDLQSDVITDGGAFAASGAR